MSPQRIANTIPRKTGPPDLARRQPQSYARQGRRNTFTRGCALKLCDLGLPFPQLACQVCWKVRSPTATAAAAAASNRNPIVCSLPSHNRGEGALQNPRFRFLPCAIEAPTPYAEVGVRIVHSVPLLCMGAGVSCFVVLLIGLGSS